MWKNNVLGYAINVFIYLFFFLIEARVKNRIHFLISFGYAAVLRPRIDLYLKVCVLH